ncbi:hypothetical protein HUJ04_012740 [Dendroctonus ponderosae]|uniref:Uncharacterized protein n=1 Tax=Dendroctonus ponderosae TaxID=77166 RepID=A0AAR5PX03_DENPD|nr:hypothetical protein HUJ04_012740 [Dendroctonus ponderosae]
MHFRTALRFWVFCLVPGSLLAISNKHASKELAEAILDISNRAIHGRQNRQYYSEIEKLPSYYQSYDAYQHRYGSRPSFYPDYISNQIPGSEYQNPRPSYAQYSSFPYRKPPIIEKTKESVMDALFSIAQNDDLQCVPKLLCELTSGGLTGRQGGLNLPVNLNSESLTTLLSGFSSAQMSPVLHFGKAAVLGFASKGNPRSCQTAYPECPSDADKLIQYLNNHNGGFFRFFQGLNPTGQNLYQQNYAQQLSGYRPGYFGKALAEKRIQNRPSEYLSNDINREVFVKKHKGLSFPELSHSAVFEPHGISFPSHSYNAEQVGEQSFKFPSDPYRRGKTLHFSTDDENVLDIQRPLPNHVPSPNIFPDRTGTGELKLDLDDEEQNYQQSLAYDFDQYNQLLYNSFPNDEVRRPSRLHFPSK